MSGLIDRVNEALSKAQAMVYMTHGSAGESFRSMSDETQDRFLWALCDHIESAALQLAQLQDELNSRKGGANGN